MAITLSAPRNSFVQFSESSAVQSCNFSDIHLCLPVYAETDIAFQFVAHTDEEEEADDLCDLTNDKIQIGIVEQCEDGFLLNFTTEYDLKPQRFRIGPKQVLYNWGEGLPGFDGVIPVGQCFMIKVVIEDLYSFCSVCFQRIGDPCHTSAIEYGNDENAFGFNYCSSEGESVDEETCEPTIIQFTNEEQVTIPYTAGMTAKYGLMPSVQIWIYDENGELVDMGIRAAFDSYPPTELRVYLGGTASGIIKIM